MLAQIALASAFNTTEGFDLSPGAEFGAESGAFWGLQGHWFFASRVELAPHSPPQGAFLRGLVGRLARQGARAAAAQSVYQGAKAGRSVVQAWGRVGWRLWGVRSGHHGARGPIPMGIESTKNLHDLINHASLVRFPDL